MSFTSSRNALGYSIAQDYALLMLHSRSLTGFSLSTSVFVGTFVHASSVTQAAANSLLLTHSY